MCCDRRFAKLEPAIWSMLLAGWPTAGTRPGSVSSSSPRVFNMKCNFCLNLLLSVT